MDSRLTPIGPSKLKSYLSVDNNLLFINYSTFPKVNDCVYVKEGSVIELSGSIIDRNEYYVTCEIHCKLLNNKITNVLSNNFTNFRPVRSENTILPDVFNGRYEQRSPYLPSGRSNNTKRSGSNTQCIHYIYARDDSKRQCRNYAINGSSYCHVHCNRH
jgi:hypothetical protein